ncbi:MAG: hypothetical protein ACTTJO_01540 [Metamycoplasmataceae bacterium]|uniref:hypothetical protein n=1 Tax=Mycoplasmopsis lipophila TaxID=2117 RepID=UPI003872D66A
MKLTFNKKIILPIASISSIIFSNAAVLRCTNEYKEFYDVINNKKDWKISPTPIVDENTKKEMNDFIDSLLSNNKIKQEIDKKPELINKIPEAELKYFTADYLLAMKKFSIPNTNLKYKFLKYEIIEVLDKYDEKEGLASVEIKMKVFHKNKPALSKRYTVSLHGFKYVNPHNHLTNQDLVNETNNIKDGWKFNFQKHQIIDNIWELTKTK